eukprot:scaffold3541_cov117-Isochrysis_galbana.AAC.14
MATASARWRLPLPRSRARSEPGRTVSAGALGSAHHRRGRWSGGPAPGTGTADERGAAMGAAPAGGDGKG